MAISFADLLRRSRSKPVAALHKFLTNYDPNNRRRVYAFVEGDPDRAFYRAHMQSYVRNISDVYVYNCEGKAQVYDAFRKIVARYPTCRRVLFFVDKDVDDIIGKPWPSDPRIFVTDYYSIENYLVVKEALSRYFADYVKSRRIEVSLEQMTEEFDRQLAQFFRIVTPLMAWIVVMRRAGQRVVLTDINVGQFCGLSDQGTGRRCRKHLSYLNRVSQTPERQNIWRDVRKTYRELQRLEAKRYIRGKFEAWWFVKFVNKLIEQLAEVAREENGSVSVSVALNENNYVQLLALAVPTPAPLASFLEFHLQGAADAVPNTEGTSRTLTDRVLRLLGF